MADAAVVTAEFVAIAATGERVAVTVRVHRPRRSPDGGWTCPVRLDGLLDRPASIAGEDALQALCLALRFAERLLRHVEARGGRLESPYGEPVALAAYFGDPPHGSGLDRSPP